MKLKDVLKKYNYRYPAKMGKLEIIYRTIGPNGEDLFAGSCVWDRAKNALIPLDGDSYSFDDNIFDYDFDKDYDTGKEYLQVWYGSEWDWADG